MVINLDESIVRLTAFSGVHLAEKLLKMVTCRFRQAATLTMPSPTVPNESISQFVAALERTEKVLLFAIVPPPDDRYPLWTELLVCNSSEESENLASFLETFVADSPRHVLGCADDIEQNLEIAVVLGKRDSCSWMLFNRRATILEPLIATKSAATASVYRKLRGSNQCLVLLGNRVESIIANKYVAVVHSITIVEERELKADDPRSWFHIMLEHLVRQSGKHRNSRNHFKA